MALKLNLYQWCGLLLALAMPTLADFDCSEPPEVFNSEEHIYECCAAAKDIETEVTKKCKGQADPICEAECLFNETKIVENGEINHGHLEAYLKAEFHNDAEFISISTQAFEKCLSMVKEKHEAEDQKTESCNTMPFKVDYCAALKMFANCPASKWKTSSTCEEAKTFSEHCALL